MKTAVMNENVIDLRAYRTRPKTDVRNAAQTALGIAERIVNSLSAAVLAICLMVCTLIFFTML